MYRRFLNSSCSRGIKRVRNKSVTENLLTVFTVTPSLCSDMLATFEVLAMLAYSEYLQFPTVCAMCKEIK